MGFLDSLKEVGIGNTGPYGRMTSGATNLNNYVQQRQGLEAERGVTQSLALAAKDGRELTMADYIDISDKWGVPLTDLIKRGTGINNTIFSQKAKTKLRKAMEQYMNDRKQPGFSSDEKYVMGLFEKVGIQDPRIMGMFKDSIVKLQDQKKFMAVGPYDDVLSLANNKVKTVHEGQDKPSTGKKEKVTMWVLPNRETVRSYDEGRTYILANGKQAAMPQGANKISTQMSGTDIATLRGQKKLQEDLAKNPAKPAGGPSARQTAEEGTGPWAMVAAGVDAVAGGLGLDKLVGKDGFFPTIMDARQDLRLIKQMGKAALMNSSRGAIWEQQKIDKLFPDPNNFFTNPRTEARKFVTLKNALVTEKQFNKVAMSTATDPDEIERLKSSNTDIDRLLAHINTGKSDASLPPLSPQAEAFLKKKGY